MTYCWISKKKKKKHSKKIQLKYKPKNNNIKSLVYIKTLTNHL